MNIYIAGASAEIERCERMRDACKGMGYHVPRDWCAMVRSVGQANGPLPVYVQRAAKRLAYEGATTCDVFAFLLPTPPLNTSGAWCEVAWFDHASTVTNRESLIVGDPNRSVMLVDHPCVASDEEALHYLCGLLADAKLRGRA